MDDVFIPPAFMLGPRPINDAGVQIIRDFEGLHLTPYLCPAKVWTIGYGHTRTVRQGMTITKEQAEQLLQDDLFIVRRAVSRLVAVPLNDNQYAALVCFSFNIGNGNFEASTLLKLLNRGWYEQVPAQLMRWNKVGQETLGGLTRRRRAEAALWGKTLGSRGTENA